MKWVYVSIALSLLISVITIFLMVIYEAEIWDYGLVANSTFPHNGMTFWRFGENQSVVHGKIVRFHSDSRYQLEIVRGTYIVTEKHGKESAIDCQFNGKQLLMMPSFFQIYNIPHRGTQRITVEPKKDTLIIDRIRHLRFVAVKGNDAAVSQFPDLPIEASQ